MAGIRILFLSLHTEKPSRPDRRNDRRNPLRRARPYRVCGQTKISTSHVQDISPPAHVRAPHRQIRRPLFHLLDPPRAVQYGQLHHAHPDHPGDVRPRVPFRAALRPSRIRFRRGVAQRMAALRLHLGLRRVQPHVRAHPAGHGHGADEPAVEHLPLPGGMDGREHAHAHAAKDAQRTVRQRHQPQRRIFQRAAQGRHHVAHHAGRDGRAVLHHQHAASSFPRTVPHHRLSGGDVLHLVGTVGLLDPLPAARGTHHRQHRQETAPPRHAEPAAHGRHGERPGRVAVGREAHQGLQRHELHPPEILRHQRRVLAAAPLDGAPPAAGIAHERVSRGSRPSA